METSLKRLRKHRVSHTCVTHHHFCFLFTEIPRVTALQHSDAVLTCPHAQGDVTWSRSTSTGDLLKFLTVRDGLVWSSEQRFGSRENHQLVIRNVVQSDTSLYLCNGRTTVYLEVTVGPKDQPVTPRCEQKGTAAGVEPPPSDSWKVPVAVLGGAALVLLSMLTLRLWKARKAARSASGVEAEVVYEEIGNRHVEPGLTAAQVESPYCCSEIRAPALTPPPLYSTVHKTTPGARAADPCVYYLTQSPSQTS